MFKYFLLILSILTFVTSVVADDSSRKVIVIVPLEHESMTQIVSGIKEIVIDAEVIVQNAQGDNNIMLALIKQNDSKNPYIIMPIGISACQMTMSHIQKKPIVCVAADMHSDSKWVTGLNDEVPISVSLSKLPKLRKIALIYSATEKVFSEVEALKSYAVKNNVKIHSSIIQTLVDLPSAVRSMPEDIDAFVILKDHLIVSGINILVQEANKRAVPVIASDEGSVINGATFSIGVKEKSVGIIAGSIANKILQGAKPSDIAYKTIEELTVFTNAKSFIKQKILNNEDIEKLGMPHVIVGGEQ